MHPSSLDALEAIFNPKSIAVIGASDTFGKWGHRMVDRPLKTGYQGPIYPINPRKKEILGLAAYPSVGDVPGHIDLAVITTPTATVPDLLKGCAARGIKGAVVITAGFAETGETGRRLENEMMAVARAEGIRIVGPNCMGIFSASGRLSLCFQQAPKSGSISFVSQSGTFGVSIAQVAASQGYGLSKFVSIGNQADLGVADYVEYLADDPETHVIALYVEGFKDGERFFQVARRAIRKKPIVIYKAGRSEAAERAALSHTASVAGSSIVFDNICRQIGLLQVRESFHLFEMAQALAGLPLPNGNRVAILGSGGQGVVGTDACAALGLELPRLDSDTAARINALLPSHAPPARNPVDFAGATRTAMQEAEIIEQFLRLDYIDGVISNVPVSPQLFDSHLVVDRSAADHPPHIKAAIDGGARYAALPGKYGKPVICLRFANLENDIMEEMLGEGGIPVYSSPEQCARAMYALVHYGRVRGKKT
ncbi:acetate--CoA ligase family protein [Desulfatitalea tepidiphila]|uniref:acetate--CoA ligase family protein n=1 Tax=Desulfatitalea tepidiphila TaxID=1185843 RepID=UPI0006B61E3C|nr:CoA-binding protein [Desulfatitalea tepidiphila]